MKRSSSLFPRPILNLLAARHIHRLVLPMLVVLAVLATPTYAQVFFSEYVEGSTTNKALEIYNGSGGAVDLAASGYEVIFYFDGAATPSRTIGLAGVIAPGGVHVLAHENADAAILAQADQIEAAGFFDGNDAIVLVNQGGIVDAIGQVGVDPVTEWGTSLQSTRDNTLCRRSSILTGDTDPTDAFGPAVEWVGYVMDTFDFLGDHTAGGLPVELTSFVALAVDRDVVLRWTTASEFSNAGFEIQEVTRGVAGTEVLGFVPGAGLSDRPTAYSYRMPAVEPGLHIYRLKQVDFDGSFEYVGSTEAYVLPGRFGLISVYPNPFNPAARVDYSLADNSRIRLSVFDVIGREVAVLFDGIRVSGVYSADFEASGLVSGVYVVQLRSDYVTDYRTVVLSE